MHGSESGDASCREQVVLALETMDSDKVIPILINALEDEHYKVRIAAVEALGKRQEIGVQGIEALIRVLKDISSDLRIAAVHALEQFKYPGAAKPLVDLLCESSSSRGSGFLEPIIEALKKIEPPAIYELRQGLNNPDWSSREKIIFALDAVGGDQVVELLIQALGDKEDSVRSAAINGLIKRPDDHTIELLISSLRDQSTRRGTARTLGEIKSPAASEHLVKMLIHCEIEVTEALIKIGLPAVPFLIEALGDGNAIVRREAVKILVELQDGRAIEPFISLINDQEFNTRLHVVNFLGSSRTTEAVAPLINVAFNNIEDPIITQKAINYVIEMKPIVLTFMAENEGKAYGEGPLWDDFKLENDATKSARQSLTKIDELITSKEDKEKQRVAAEEDRKKEMTEKIKLEHEKTLGRATCADFKGC